MRTTDFSLAPPIARVQAVVISSAARPGWRPMRVVRIAGRPKAWLAVYADATDAERAAAELDPAQTRVLAVDEHGYANGRWSTAGVLSTIERFSPTSAERTAGRTPPRPADAGPPPPRIPRRDRVAPDPTETGAMFFGATKYRSPLSWLAFSRRWFPMVRRMQAMPGYRGHAIYWSAPFTLGTIGLFADLDTMYAVARGPEHRFLMTWLTKTGIWATAGYIRTLRRPADARP